MYCVYNVNKCTGTSDAWIINNELVLEGVEEEVEAESRRLV